MFVITVAVFARSATLGFVNWDDDLNFTLNPEYRGLSASHLWWMLTTFHMGHWHPLTWLTLGLDYALWQDRPAGYHITNVVLHSLTAAAMVFLAARVFELTMTASRFSDVSKRVVAILTATIIFALHPLRVESVAWVTERRDCLSGLFYVLCVIAYLRYTGARRAREPARTPYLLCLLWFALSLVSKAWAITLPGVFLVLDGYPLRRWRDERDPWKTLLIEKVPFAVMSVVVAIVGIRAAASVGAMHSVVHHGLLDRVAQASYGLMFYLVKTVAPFQLHVAHDLPVDLNPFAAPFLAAMIGVLVITVASLLSMRRAPAIASAWFCYGMIVFPALGLAQSGTQLVADRYSYLASIPVALLIAGGLARVMTPRTWRLVSWGVTGVAIGLMVLTWRQIGVWRDSETLWRHALAIDPDSATANAYLADYLFNTERAAESVAYYKRSLATSPHQRKVQANLGITLASLGRYEDALPHLQAVITQEETRESLGALAAVHVMTGHDDARETLARYFDRWPTAHSLRLQLYHEAYKARRYDLAMFLLRDGLKHAPNDAGMTRQLAWLLATAPDASLRDGEQAVALLTPLVDANNASPRDWDLLAAAYAEQGDFDSAVRFAELAINALDPTHVFAKQVKTRLDHYRRRQPHREPE